MNFRKQKWVTEASVLALTAMAFSSPVYAQPGGAGAAPVEEVVVTGTSIRGTAPVGSNLVTVGPQEIEATSAQTIEQVLASVPSLSSFGHAGQGQTNSSYYAPTIHSLGASASNSTLVLIDGHRVPEGGTNHPTVDPNIVSPAMIERVEVLADGASATYGSDAVAGVVNFITRKDFQGVQLNGQASFLDGAHNYNASVLTGTHWSGGSALFSYAYSYSGQLMNTDRPYTNPNHIGQGGTNFNNFNCSPATLQPGSVGNIYLNATSGASIANTAANSPCSTWAYTALIPKEVRNNAMIKVSQNFGDNFSVIADLVYGNRRDTGAAARGTLTATAFGTGAQANPFYMTPTGYAGAATSENIRWDADELLGRGALSINGSDTFYGHANLEYNVDDNFVIDLMALAGRDDTFAQTIGVMNASVANLALNGTTNSGGSTTAVSVPGTTTIVTNLPLTTATALDVWNPASTNRTSAAVRSALTDNANFTRQTDGVEQVRLSTNGSLFSLPAGKVKVALGAEVVHRELGELVAQSNNTGPASTGSLQKQYEFSRKIYSGFGEVNAPIVSPDMNIFLVEKFEVNVSGRYDSYSDFGDTSNYKLAFNWDVIDSFRLRGSMSTSFVAPQLDMVGNQFGVYAQSGYTNTTNSLNVPVASYPLLPSLGIAGCTTTSVSCNISSIQGIQITNGNHNMQPQKGRGWSVGADFTPEFLPGFTGQFTYWDNKFTGGITTPNLGIVVNNQSLNYLLTLYPAGATAAQIATATANIPQTGVLPAKTSYIFDFFNGNYLNLHTQGIDASLQYKFDTGLGTFTVGDNASIFTLFDQSFGAVSNPTFSVLNTVGANQTFPSVQTQMRINLDWAMDAWAADVFVNYTGAYRNWSGNVVNPLITNAAGNPIGGGDPVKSNVTVDLHVAYNFDTGLFGDDQISITVRNLFDREAPFYNSASGYDTYVSSPLGRVVTLGFKANL